MSLSDQEFDKMQKYFDGELSRKEKKNYLSEFKKDSNLSKYLDFEDKLCEHLLLSEVDNHFIRFGLTDEDFNFKHSIESRTIISDLKKRFKKANIVYISSRPAYYLAAASIIGTVVICSVVYFYLHQQEKNTFANRNGTVEDSPISQKNDHSPLLLNEETNYADLAGVFYEKDSIPAYIPYILQQELEGYADGNFTAIQQLNVDNLQNTYNNEEDSYIKTIAYYYKGLSYIETSDLNNAIINLTAAINTNPTPQIRIRASWYLALSYLKQKNANSAMPLLNEVKNNNWYPSLRKSAVELISKITAK